MTFVINGTTGATQSASFDSASTFGFKNRIINGAMMIDQRNAGASVTPTTNPTYTLDRWNLGFTAASKLSVQQNAGSVTPPNGFVNYLGITSLSAYSVGSGDTFLIQQSIEGVNTSDLGWGTASAATVTISFWVRSSLTGSFGGSVVNSGATRAYPFTYTISSANTWEQKSVTITGDTTGTWLTTTGTGLNLRFGLGSGSTYSGTAGAWVGANIVQPTGGNSVVGTNGATWYITGVQLEKGSTATSFDYRPYGTELALCQRYAIRYCGQGTYSGIGIARVGASTSCYTMLALPVEMRAKPSLSSSGTFEASGIAVTSFSIDSNSTTTKTFVFSSIVASGLTTGQAAYVSASNDSNASFLLSSEL